MQNSCWFYAGTISRTGYGVVWNKFIRNYEQAHRLVYEAIKGKIPEDLQIDHLCRNTNCVNPDHLEAVTSKENTLRGIGITAINYKKTYCIHGHKFSVENTYLCKEGRHCRICDTDAQNKFKLKALNTPAKGTK